MVLGCVLVGLGLLAPVALGAGADTDLAIRQFAITPDTTQAGGNPNVGLFFRFCSPGSHIDSVGTTAPYRVVTTDVSGVTTGSTVKIWGVTSNPDANGKWTVTLDGADPTGHAFFLTTKKATAVGDNQFAPGPYAQVAGLPNYGCTGLEQTGRLKDFVLRLPPGFLGNPIAAPVCPEPLWVAAACPDSTILGYSITSANPEGNLAITAEQTPVKTAVYNVQTLGLEPARLGTGSLGSTPPGPFPIVITLRSDRDEDGTVGNPDYGINSALINIPKNLGGVAAIASQVYTVLCAQVPCIPTNPNDPASVVPNPTASPTGQTRPFFRNPTSCTPAVSKLEAVSWVQNGVIDSKTSTFTPTGCNNVPFDPALTVTPTESSAVAAGGAQKVSITYPTYTDAPIWQSALRNADVTLPSGMTLSPGGGNGLAACTFDEFGVSPTTGKQLNNDPDACPNGSQIGTISVSSPVLPDGSLGGKVFFGPVTAPGRPTPAQPWKLFLLIEGAGLRIKLVGNVDVAEDGTIHNVFVDQPEVPFTRLDLNLNGGDKAVLANPSDCDTHTGHVVLTGWSGKTNPSTPSITPTDCADPQQFAPHVDQAGSDPETAGANTTSNIVISRADGQKDISSLKLSLPVGAVGSLAAVPMCPIATARAGACSTDSKVGIVNTTVGSANSLLTVTGSLYLSEPDQPDDAATLALVVPAKVGPIDLGQVVVINHVKLRPSDTGVDAITESIPGMLGGVPLHIRRIEIKVNRPGFFLNPTGCDSRPLTATFAAPDGTLSSSTMLLNAKNCDALPFNPKLKLIAGGPGLTKTGSHPPLKAIVTQKSGEANISSSRVVLPDILRPNVPQFNKPGGLCSDAQFAARACPALSHAGDARVVTPVLPFTLSGPVYVVQETGSILPKLYVDLKGRGIEVVLRAKNSFQGIRTVNTFDGLPDVPQAYFQLSIFGGPNGILNAFNDLCKASPRPFDTSFTGQNGKTVKARPFLDVDGCATASATGATISSSTVKVSRSGIAKIRMSCRLTKTCAGRLSLSAKGLKGAKKFSIKAKKRGTVKVKISKKGMKKLRKAKRLRTRASSKVGSATTRKTITLVAPSRKKKKH
jgi:hypothetical protein